MERVTVRELSRNTSVVLARVQHGECLEVMSGAAVARLLPIEPGHKALDQLVADGRAVPPTIAGPVPMPSLLGDADVDTAGVLADMRGDEPL